MKKILILSVFLTLNHSVFAEAKASEKDIEMFKLCKAMYELSGTVQDNRRKGISKERHEKFCNSLKNDTAISMCGSAIDIIYLLEQEKAENLYFKEKEQLSKHIFVECMIPALR